MFNYVAGTSTTGMEGISQGFVDAEQQLSVMDSTVEGVPGYGAIAR